MLIILEFFGSSQTNVNGQKTQNLNLNIFLVDNFFVTCPWQKLCAFECFFFRNYQNIQNIFSKNLFLTYSPGTRFATGQLASCYCHASARQRFVIATHRSVSVLLSPHIGPLPPRQSPATSPLPPRNGPIPFRYHPAAAPLPRYRPATAPLPPRHRSAGCRTFTARYRHVTARYLPATAPLPYLSIQTFFPENNKKSLKAASFHHQMFTVLFQK